MRAVGRMRLESRERMGHWGTLDDSHRSRGHFSRGRMWLGGRRGDAVRLNGVDYPETRPC